MSMIQHPLSAAFPAMPREDFEHLVADIVAHGQREAGVILDGMVLDGWHRYLACEKTSRRFLSVEYAGDDPIAYVMSKNLHRRHLTASQRAEAIVACGQWRSAGKYDRKADSPLPDNSKVAPGATLENTTGVAENVHIADAGMTNEEMARMAGVSPRTIRQAKTAHQAGLGDAVRDGELSVKQAAEIAKLPEEERAQAIEAPKPKPQKVDDKLRDRVAELEAENEALRDQLAEMSANLKAAMLENEELVKVFEADDKLAASLAENKRIRALNLVLEERIRGLQNERNEAIRIARSARAAADKAERANAH